ncbi:MAG: non-canonical purine NTP pyrophosphatase [Spirochaetaceae bacterium]|nr:non-canonical purine NTP pyrophosphatase [Spirochaetaceae bacterium]
MKIFLASGNQHKKKEMSAIFSKHQIVLPSDEGIDFDVEENGDSFVANSLIKAETLYRITKQPVLADDSGICVDILGGAPGIFSSRYAGRSMRRGNPDGTIMQQEQRNLLLLEDVAQELAQNTTTSSNRSCHYVCAMVLYLGPDRFYVAQETMEGYLISDISEAKGERGFGYDPIVILKDYNKTVAELSDEEKNKVSHRGKAGRILQTLLDTIEK